MGELFEQIREATRDVAAQAPDVEIVDERIREYARELPMEAIAEPERDEELHYLGHGEETVAYVVTLDAVNFGSGYFPWTQPRDGDTEYAMVARALTDRFERHGPFEPDRLTELTAEDCGELFAQEIQHDERRRLMASYAHVLGELGEHLVDHYGGSYTELVESADRSAAELVRRLTEIPSFRDVVLYQNTEVPFYKKAQITASDLHLAFEGTSWGAFDDIDELTIFADNRLPHVLRLDDVLVYSDALAERIDRRELLPAGSREEIEIRACAVHAAERIADQLGERRDAGRVPPRLLDNHLWHRGGTDRYRVRPAHLTRTVFY